MMLNNIFERTIIKALPIKKFYDICFIDTALIGDILVTLPYYNILFEKLRKLKKKFIVISNPSTYIFFKVLGADVFTVDVNKFIQNPFYKVKSILKLGKFNSAFISHPNRLGTMEILLDNIYAKKKYLYEGEKIYENHYNPLYNIKYKVLKKCFKEEGISHISKHLSCLFKQILKLFDLDRGLNFNIKPQDYKNLFQKVFSFHTKNIIDGNYIVILPDSSTNFRIYPKENWQKVLNELPGNIKIIQLGLKKFPLEHPNLIDLTGKTSLEEAISIVINAKLVIGNETGLTHLAYLSGIPTVCILGGGHFSRFLPWSDFKSIVKCVYNYMNCFQCGWKCKYVSLEKGEIPPCIYNISPEKILEAVNMLMQKFNIKLN